jgi:trans-aconitate methyltransferase
MREWNAETYHRLSNPQFNWGTDVLERLPLRGDELVLDVGCGSGRLTEMLLERLPRGCVRRASSRSLPASNLRRWSFPILTPLAHSSQT